MTSLAARSAALLTLAALLVACSSTGPDLATTPPTESSASAIVLGDRAPAFPAAKAPPAAPTCTGKQGRPLFGTRRVTLDVGGRQRAATIKVPSRYDRGRGIPV